MNKEVCKRCIEKASENNLRVTIWREIDEIVWEKGVVYCPTIAIREMKSNSGGAKVSELPPKGCPYILEHMTQ